ncbi:MAG: CobW family GTP-binding protein [Aggregatilineales bacterium]
MALNHTVLRNPIPLTILTGFLGAGKTTLLNRILNGDHGLKIAVMVNDFGTINIDSQLVVDVSADDTINLSNGCICCTIRGDLLEATQSLVNRNDPPDYIIIETSGVSDPLEVALTFRYMPQVEIDSVLTIVDSSEILDVAPEHKVLAMNQIGMADILILNKVDLVNAETLQAVRHYARKIMPSTRLLETTHAHVPLELMLNVGNFSAERFMSREPGDVHVHTAAELASDGHAHDHDHAHVHDDHTLIFSTWSWETDQPISMKALQRTMEQLPLSIYRAKGIFFLADSPDSQAVLQVVGKRINLNLDGEKWGDRPLRSQCVFIGTVDGIDADALQAQMDACLASNVPASDAHQLATAALRWLRRK